MYIMYSLKLNEVLGSRNGSNAMNPVATTWEVESLSRDIAEVSFYEIEQDGSTVFTGATAIKKPKSFLANAFSTKMLTDKFATVEFEEVESLPFGLISAIGHADTAAVLQTECNRIDVKLAKGATLYIAELQGGRLPEGTTTLPEGCRFRFIKATIR